MTAYGRAFVDTAAGSFRIELQSVNRKGLDIAIQLPKEWLFLDMHFRRRLMKNVSRGYVTMRLSIEGEGKVGGVSLPPSIEQLKKRKEAWGEIAHALGYEPEKVLSFDWLLANPILSSSAAMELESEKEVEQKLLGCLDAAIGAWMEMKEKEGGNLLKPVFLALQNIDQAIEKIEQDTKTSPKRYKEKLEARLEELTSLVELDEERLLREIVFFADKIDISEEIARLQSHATQFRDYLASNRAQLGKELGFLLQEMLRETNTIGSKSPELTTIQLTLMIKSELEKIREQIQNLE